MWRRAAPVKDTETGSNLRTLPPPGKTVAVAVYGFTDQTGQFKPTDGAQTLSRAVTQGATSILMKALREAGDGRWFLVIERERVDNVLRERAIIREMRATYLNEKTVNPSALPPLLFAGVLLEGGIVGYDSNTKTGGAGANFLGIGGNQQYREDTVTVYLRAVSVRTGEVLTDVSVRKSVDSYGIGANAFRYVAYQKLLQVETGVTMNEPGTLAMQQAIDEAVNGLIFEGLLQGLWCFNAAEEQSSALVKKYISERDGTKEDRVVLPRQADGKPKSFACPVLASRNQLPVSVGSTSQVFPSISSISRTPAVNPEKPAQNASAVQGPR
jgi:curli production assembly/transport component CsgG